MQLLHETRAAAALPPTPPQRRRRPRPRAEDAESRAAVPYTTPPGSSVASVRPIGHGEVASASGGRAGRIPRTGIAIASTAAAARLPTLARERPPESHLPAASLASDAASATAEEHEEAEVPREARLLRDRSGQAHLHWRLCASLLLPDRPEARHHPRGPERLCPETSRYSVLENVSPSAIPLILGRQRWPPPAREDRRRPDGCRDVRGYDVGDGRPLRQRAISRPTSQTGRTRRRTPRA